MTEKDLKKMIAESVMRILNEGDAWEAFKSGLNLKGIGKYARDRIWDGHKEHAIGSDSEEEKRKKELKAFEDWQAKNPGKNHEDYIQEKSRNQ